MNQVHSDFKCFEAHWHAGGKLRTLRRLGGDTAQYGSASQISHLRVDEFGGPTAIVHAGSSKDAYLIADQHFLCILMKITNCNHVRADGPGDQAAAV